ncbi:MAG TPA: alpha/beta hydrolase domain-containing protein [Bryobacteraceae bacterium]|nr:alpha/beta hydrolase domain-containing protein [Bryobacteraceae bacterium]
MVRRIVIAATGILVCAAGLPARVTRIVIEQRESPAYGGRVFGKAGQYETLSGRFFGEIDPKDPHNAIIMDIAFAPRNARGTVEYSATFVLSKPIDMSKSNGVLYYNVPNRGRGAPAGSEDGRVNLLSGWQGDLRLFANAQTITVPVARNPDSSPLTGLVMERLIDIAPNTNTIDLGATGYVGLTYQHPLTLDTSKASLTRRTSQNAQGEILPAGDWAFADCTRTPFPGKPDETRICVKEGFDPASEYVLAYTAKDPLVLGIGFAATRDLHSFLRHAARDDQGTANPVAGQIHWAISRGDSQSGNFIRSFIQLGFNQDEAGYMVWDGANPHIAARKLALNFRFAVASGYAAAGQPGSEGVLWWSDYPDKARGGTPVGMLDRCRASNTCPKIFETFGGIEFWFLRESPDLVGTDAKSDIPLPPNVRRYFFPGTTHGGGRGGFSAVAPKPPAACVLPANPNPESDTMRALTVALIDWVTKGTEPPPSRYPRLEDGQLAPPTQAALKFPKIPGVPSPDGLVNPLYDYDFGPDFNYNDESGLITKQPPVVKRILPTLVPKVDADGTDLGGVPSVLRQVPLGTYLGWNVTAAGFDKGKICALNGGYVPFAKTRAERVAAGDPRPSLEERYGSHAAYVAAVKAAANKAVAERFLLRADADRLIAEAVAS